MNVHVRLCRKQPSRPDPIAESSQIHISSAHTTRGSQRQTCLKVVVIDVSTPGEEQTQAAPSFVTACCQVRRSVCLWEQCVIHRYRFVLRVSFWLMVLHTHIHKIHMPTQLTNILWMFVRAVCMLNISSNLWNYFISSKRIRAFRIIRIQFFIDLWWHFKIHSAMNSRWFAHVRQKSLFHIHYTYM